MLFRSKPSGLASEFGALELRVLEAMWRRGGETAVRDLRAEFPAAAYTTLMTTMDRLHRKGVLERRKIGRAFVYRAAATRDELEGAVATELVQSLFDRSGAPLPILSSLVDAVSDRDRALLDDLERLIREKRRSVSRGGRK